MADDLPTAEQAFGAPPDAQGQALPTAEQAFGPAPPPAPKSGPMFDGIFTNSMQGRTLDAFGQGAKYGWGSEPLGISGETEQFLEKSGVFNDYSKNRTDLIKTFNESIMRPAAVVGDLAMRTMGAAFYGTGSALRQVATEIQGSEAPGVVKAVAAAYAGEYGEIAGGLMEGFGPELAHPLSQARSLGVVGEGEGGYFGTKTPTPESEAARADAIKAHLATKAEGPPIAGTPEEGEGIPGRAAAGAPPPPDIHAVARGLAPQTFAEYDAASARRDSYRDQLNDMAETRAESPAGKAAQAEIDTILGKVNGVEDRLTNKAAERLEAARGDLADVMRRDTPEMTAIRTELQKADYRMRDLSPDVARAYRLAQEQTPQSAGVAEPVVARETPPPEQAQAGVGAPPPEAVKAAPSIADDVSQKLVAAGRPKEEADAAAAIVQAHYETRADRFGGAKGTPEQLYASEGPNIVRGGRQTAPELELAQRELDQTAYHGSPARFDEFSNEKIGTGEGAQSYGYGHYFAGKKGVAEYYRDKLSARGLPTKPVVINGMTLLRNGKAMLLNDDWHGDLATLIEFANEKGITNSGDLVKALDDPKTSKGWFDRTVGAHAVAKRLANILADRGPFEIGKNPKAGTLYEVDLRPGEDEYLHWDRPLKQQSESVKKAISRISGESVLLRNPDATGSDIYRDMVERERYYGSRDPEKAASDRLASLDVPGIKYRDAGSRQNIRILAPHESVSGKWVVGEAPNGPNKYFDTEKDARDYFAAQQAAQTHNYVIFDPKNVAIKSYEQSKRGSITLRDSNATIRLFKDADASTFMHETGHQWLEELMRDAKTEGVHPDVVTDAATVRKWLGVEPDAPIPTRAHEKFARGFERYLMEGRAPTQALASVFAKFKDWLTKIYQTVAKLRAPINDDIRDVFDRLITTKPEKTIIAPERETGSTLAELHEADAEHTPPQYAADVADRVRGEIDDTVKVRKPEVYDEFPKGKAGGIAAENAGLTGRGNAPEPIAGGRATAQELGTEPARGNETQKEGAQPRGERGTIEQPTGPNERFAPTESPLIDKAGNIRLDNLNTPEDVNAVLRDVAEAHGGFMGARRGVISDAQALDLADALGMDPASLNMRKIGEAFNSEQILAARKLLIQSASSVRDAMAKAAVGTDEEVLAYAESRVRHIMIQEQVSGITAEAGRALRAFRALEGSKEAQQLGDFLKENTGKTLFQMRQEAQLGMSLDTPQKISKFINDSKKPTFSDMLVEYWVNGLISGPATHTTYMVGNALLAMWKAVPETAVASAIGNVRHLFGDTSPRVMPGEVGAAVYGMMKGSREGIYAAGEAAKTGMTTLLPGEERADFALQKGQGSIPGLLGTVIRLPSRGVAMIHSFFRAVGYSQAKAALAYRAASEEGLTGEAFAARVADLSVNPSEEIMQAARVQSTEQTLMGKGGEFTQTLARLSDKPILGVPILKFIMPFVKIGSNIMSQGLLERTPLGILDPHIRANLMGVNGPIARDTQIARIAIGTALGATTVGLAAEGLITGGGPMNPKEAAIYAAAHGPPYRVRIGDTWYGIHRLGPLAMIMGVGADMYEFGHAMDGPSADKIGSLIVASITKGILDESWMRGPSQLIQALEEPEQYGARWVRDEISSFLPFSVGMGQVARAIDPYSREARTTMDAIKAKVPWLSETLLPRRDVFGEPIPNKEALGVAGLSAIYEQKVNRDPVYQALLKLNIFPGQPTRKIRNVTLTDQQYDDYSRISGRMMKLRLNAIVSGPGFADMPASAQIDLINEAIKTSREAGRSLVMMQNPDIIRTAVANKTAKLRGETVH